MGVSIHSEENKNGKTQYSLSKCQPLPYVLSSVYSSKSGKPFYHGINCFNYWKYAGVNPLIRKQYGKDDKIIFNNINYDKFAQKSISDDYEERFKNGDENAIFDYMQNDIRAFRSEWVVKTIERWRSEDTKKSQSKYIKLVKSYFNRRKVKTYLIRLNQTIEKHKAIFKDIIECYYGKNIPVNIKKINKKIKNAKSMEEAINIALEILKHPIPPTKRINL